MNIDKLKSLQAYSLRKSERLSAETPSKHKNRDASFREYLKHDLAKTDKKIEIAKYSIPAKTR